MQQIVKQFHLSLPFGIVGTDFPERLRSGCFTLSSVRWRRERALLLHLIELLHKLFETSWANLFESLLECISPNLVRDIQLSFQELLELMKPFGLLIGHLADLGRFLELLFFVVRSHRQLLVALFLCDVGRHLHLGTHFVFVFFVVTVEVDFVRIVLVPTLLELIRRGSRFHPWWLRLAHFATLLHVVVGNFWYQVRRPHWSNG